MKSNIFLLYAPLNKEFPLRNAFYIIIYFIVHIEFYITYYIFLVFDLLRVNIISYLTLPWQIYEKYSPFSFILHIKGPFNKYLADHRPQMWRLVLRLWMAIAIDTTLKNAWKNCRKIDWWLCTKLWWWCWRKWKQAER